MTVLAETDTRRWRDVAGEIPTWDERNRLFAAQIPENSTVLDLGSGAQTLKRHLKPGCDYQPCDIIKSSDDVLLCDLNAAVYPAVEQAYDYTVCSGVLEYMRRPREFLAILSFFGKEMLVSFAPFQEGDTKLRRASEGWVNHFTQPQLEGLLDTLGFCWSAVGRWNNQIIYRVWIKNERPRSVFDPDAIQATRQ